MIDLLADELGISQSSLLAACHRASRKEWERLGAGPFEESVGVSWARDFFEADMGRGMLEAVPYPTSVLLVVGKTERMEPICSAVEEILRATEAPA